MVLSFLYFKRTKTTVDIGAYFKKKMRQGVKREERFHFCHLLQEREREMEKVEADCWPASWSGASLDRSLAVSWDPSGDNPSLIQYVV